MKKKIIGIFVVICSILSSISSASAAVICGTSPSGEAGESVGIRIVDANSDDTILYQNQTETTDDGRYYFEYDNTDNKNAVAHVGFANTSRTEKKYISRGKNYFSADFSGGINNVFAKVSGNGAEVHDFGGSYGKVLCIKKNSATTVSHTFCKNPSDYSDVADCGVVRMKFDYRTDNKKTNFVMYLLDDYAISLLDTGRVFESFAVNSDEALSYYEYNNESGLKIHYPYVGQEANKWYHIEMWLDFDMRQITYFIDNVYYGVCPMRDGFDAFTGFYMRSPENGDVYFDNMSITDIDSDYAKYLCQNDTNIPKYMTNSVRTYFSSDKTGNIFGNDENIAIDFKYASYTDLSNVTLVCKALNQKGEAVWQSSDNISEMLYGNCYTKKIIPQIQKYGIYTLECTMKLGDTEIANDEIDFSYINSTSDGRKNAKLGIVNHIAHNIGEADKLTETESKAGFGFVRDEYFWSTMEKEKGKYVLSDTYREYLDLVKENNMGILQLFSATNSLYTTEYPPVSSGVVKAFANYANELAKKLTDDTEYFEIWNEYNLSISSSATPQAYAEMCKAVNTAMERKDVKLVGVCAGQLSGENKILPWIEEFFKAGGGDYIDVLSIHIYCEDKSPEKAVYAQTVNDVENLIKKYGYNMPIWMTETGWSSSAKGISESLQAAYGVRANVELNQNTNIEKTFWYTSLKKYGHESQYEYDLGILQPAQFRNPYGATLAYLAFSNYNSMIANMTESGIKEISGDVYKADYTNGNETVSVLWADGKTANIRVEASDNVGVYDMLGNVINVTPTGGYVNLELSDEPVYIAKLDPKFELVYDGKSIKRIEEINNPEINTVTAKVKVDGTGISQNPIMYAAVYREGVLIDLKMSNTINENGEFTAELTTDGADRIGIYLWNGTTYAPYGCLIIN